MPSQLESRNPVELLAFATGSHWQNLKIAREFTIAKRKTLRELLDGIDTSDTSIVVFGSLARDEACEGSDTDWTLLVDGIADPLHTNSGQEVQLRLNSIKAKEPGREGTFGDLAFSHQIIHWIGGEDDSNANTTRRILLLLESKSVGREEARSRVIKNLLSRYLSEDRGLWDVGKTRAIPLFLLNDIARYWRIMVVDFAYKQRIRGNKGYALRNIKLGLSRKLIFASGLLACFSCELDFSDDEWREFSKTQNPQPLIDHLSKTLEMTPLEIVAERLLKYPDLLGTSKRLFDAYDKFVGLLADEKPATEGKPPRTHLDHLPIENLTTDEVYLGARKIRQEFRFALEEIFLKSNTDLRELTLQYGVF